MLCKISYSNLKIRKSCGLPGHASTSSTRPNEYSCFEPSETITWERYRLQFMRLSLALYEKSHNSSRGTIKWFYSMTTLGLMLLNPLKPIWKCSSGLSQQFHLHEDKKNGLIRRWPHKMNTFTVKECEISRKIGKSSSFSTVRLHFHKKKNSDNLVTHLIIHPQNLFKRNHINLTFSLK